MATPKAKLNTDGIDLSKLRNDFPICERIVNEHQLVYFDNAATTQKPLRVIDAVSDFYKTKNANIHRAVHTLSYEATLLYDEAHKKIAAFIGAENWRQIILTRNATESINLVAYGWAMKNLEPGDEIVVSIMEHHSNIVPWQMLREKKGIVLKFLDIDDSGNLKLDDLKKIITSKTKLVGIVHVSNVLGVINPIDEVISEAKRVGARVLVDAAQSTPHIPLDVKQMDCDFFAASGHKMLGPTGIGFLYVKDDVLDEIEPFNYGGDMIETVTTEGATWNEMPWKFEAGTPNIAGGIGLGAAIDYLSDIGMDVVFEHEKDLLNYALERLLSLDWVELYGPKDSERIGVISFNVQDIHPHDVAGFLDEKGIAVRSGHHCTQPLMNRMGIENAVRASFYIYNTREEIDKFVDELKSVYKLFSR